MISYYIILYIILCQMSTCTWSYKKILHLYYCVILYYVTLYYEFIIRVSASCEIMSSRDSLSALGRAEGLVIRSRARRETRYPLKGAQRDSLSAQGRAEGLVIRSRARRGTRYPLKGTQRDSLSAQGRAARAR